MAKRRYIKQESGIFVKSLRVRNEAQDLYMSSLRESTITFGVGPAGTGKTFLAMYVALEALLNGEVSKIILTRPIVATEDIGYLPGDMNEKIHPYLMPLFDAIEDHLGPTKARDLFSNGQLEVLPLAYMRGRSIKHAYMILDEAQNTTVDQMKMFLTRMGEGSKIAVTGDGTQSDLPNPADNGFIWAINKLRGVDSHIAVFEFGMSHIVRHPLIETILLHLERNDRKQSPAYNRREQRQQPALTLQ